MNKHLFIVLIIFVLLFSRAVSSYAWDREYSGKVIDADTKEAISNAVVVVVWTKSASTFTGTDSKLHDVKETLTDKDGRWKIEGPEGDPGSIFYGIVRIFLIHIVDPPTFIVFKPGYCAWPNGYGIDACKGKMKGNLNANQGGDVELPKLTNKEDRLRNLPGAVTGNGALKKQKKFINLINEERSHFGLGETDIEMEGNINAK